MKTPAAEHIAKSIKDTSELVADFISANGSVHAARELSKHLDLDPATTSVVMGMIASYRTQLRPLPTQKLAA